MSKHAFRTVLLVLAALLLAAGGAAAQAGPGGNEQPAGPAGSEDDVAGAITYQGVLRENGALVTGPRAMEFRIYANSVCGGTPVQTVSLAVNVDQGLFSVKLGMPDVWNGYGTWLRVVVGGTEIGCQQLLPAPYALTLRPGTVIASMNGPALSLHSSGGEALHAYADHTNADTAAVSGISDSGTGVLGRSYDWFGKGVAGYVGPTLGPAYGVYGETASDGDWTVAVWGNSTAWSGVTIGTWGTTNSSTGGARGLMGAAQATAGETYGVVGENASPAGWGAAFNSAGNGVWIGTPDGKEALGVHLGNVVIDEGNLAVGGTKSSVVDSSEGRRLLYAEEATEVWFADYGFGKLTGGSVTVALDPIFSQTVNLAEPYHVFVQPYGDAELYVTNRTAAGFEVRSRQGEPDVEFSYRIVANRLGYEKQRLERAPQPANASASQLAWPAAMNMQAAAGNPAKP